MSETNDGSTQGLDAGQPAASEREYPYYYTMDGLQEAGAINAKLQAVAAEVGGVRCLSKTNQQALAQADWILVRYQAGL